MISNFYDITVKNMKEALVYGKGKLELELQSSEEIFHSTINSNEWHVKDRRKRTLWTPLGDITLIRRIYENVVTKKQKILFDQSIGLVPMLYIQPMFFMQFITALNKVNSYKSLSDIFGNEFSTTQISNILKKQTMFLTIKKLRDKTPLLFVNLDDIHVLTNKDKKSQVRCGVAYTGTAIKNGRKVLVGKTLIPIDSRLSVNEQAWEFEKTLVKIYGKIVKVIIIGDGANWITTFKKEMTIFKTERYIDQFHYKKYVKDMLGKRVKVDWKHFVSLSQNKAIFYLLNLVTDKNGEVCLKQPKLLPKVRKWFKSFVICQKNRYPNVIEGIQSTQIARTLKNRRAFSKDNIHKILLINTAQYNNWKITFEKPKENEFNFNQNKSIITLLTNKSYASVRTLKDETTTSSKKINSIFNWNGR